MGSHLHVGLFVLHENILIDNFRCDVDIGKLAAMTGGA